MYRKIVAFVLIVCALLLCSCKEPTHDPKDDSTDITWEVKISSVGEGGTVTLDKQTVVDGGSVIIDITPKSGYYLSDLRINGY